MGGRGIGMSLIEDLTRVIRSKKYHSITFSVDDMPIMTVIFSKDKKVVMLVNSVEELRYYELAFGDDVESFTNEVKNMLTYNGIDPMIRKMKNPVIEFHGEPYLRGKIRENKIIIIQQDTVFDEDGDEVTFLSRDEIMTTIELTGATLAQIITAFAIQFYG